MTNDVTRQDNGGETSDEAVVPARREAPENVVDQVRSARPVRKTETAKKGASTPKRDAAKSAKTKVVRKRVTPSEFVRQSASELRKVIWPTGEQLSQYFVVVLAFVLFIMTIVVLLDGGLTWLLIKLLG